MTTATRLPAQQPEAPRLSAYLTGALGTAALLGASQADAAVTSVTFGFGSVLNSSTGFQPTNSVTGSSGTYGSLWAVGLSNLIDLGADDSYGAIYHNSSYNTGTGRASFFTTNTVIGLGGNGLLGFGYFNNPDIPVLEFSSNQLDKNIGFRTSAGNYGWANVSWDNTANILTIHSAYVESVSGAPITVGATSSIPEPAASAALLALAGLGVAATRRRPRPLAA